jgi:thiol-disulfide isomerase/thioredoxin
VEDTTIDYRIAEKYSVQRFVGHKIKSNDKGPPIITLMATWIGYPDSESPTEEKWGTMKKCHVRQLKRYVERNNDLKKVVEIYHSILQKPKN